MRTAVSRTVNALVRRQQSSHDISLIWAVLNYHIRDMRSLVLNILVLLAVGCGRDYTISSCVTAESVSSRYDELISSIYEGRSNFDPDEWIEIHTILHDRRHLTREEEVFANENGTLGPAVESHMPLYAAEYRAARFGEEMFAYDRIRRGADGGFFKGQGPGWRLYKTGILRGWRKFDGDIYQLLMIKTYRQTDERIYEKVELIVSYPDFLNILGCDA